jgi:hypothetical protein
LCNFPIFGENISKILTLLLDYTKKNYLTKNTLSHCKYCKHLKTENWCSTHFPVLVWKKL